MGDRNDCGRGEILEESGGRERNWARPPAAGDGRWEGW